MWPPKKKIAEYSHVHNSSENYYRESADVLHERPKYNRTNSIDDAEANHNVAYLVNSQSTRDVSLNGK